MTDDLHDCYRILDVKLGASREEIKRAYWELVRVWHPDRFAHDPALQRKAQEKLKQINLAYEQIGKSDGEEPRRAAQSEKSRPTGPAQPSGPSGSDTSPNSTRSYQEASKQPSQQSPPQTNWARRFVQLFVAVLVISIVRAIFSTNEYPRRRDGAYTVPYVQSTPNYEVPQPGLAPATPELIADTNAGAGQKTLGSYSPTGSTTRRDFFTVGSTRDEVLRVQGTPTAFSDTTLTFGLSDVYLTNGKVYSWHEYATSPLKAKLLPATQVEAKEFFTVGSTRDEVLAVQGTPTKFTDYTLTYGLSDVFLRDGRVHSWHEYATSPLKAKLLPSASAQVRARDFFTVGSTKDEVLAVQGTPTKFSDYTLTYGLSDIFLRDGKVYSWHEYATSPLKAKLLPATQIEAREFFMVGSTRDEVLAVQGTPTKFTDTTLTYGLSDVYFVNGKVVSWKQYATSPLKAR